MLEKFKRIKEKIGISKSDIAVAAAGLAAGFYLVNRFNRFNNWFKEHAHIERTVAAPMTSFVTPRILYDIPSPEPIAGLDQLLLEREPDAVITASSKRHIGEELPSISKELFIIASTTPVESNGHAPFDIWGDKKRPIKWEMIPILEQRDAEEEEKLRSGNHNNGRYYDKGWPSQHGWRRLFKNVLLTAEDSSRPPRFPPRIKLRLITYLEQLFTAKNGDKPEVKANTSFRENYVGKRVPQRFFMSRARKDSDTATR